MILHVNGEPFMRYDGPHDMEEIKRFVIEIAKKMSKNKKPQSNVAKSKAANSVAIPGYTIGKPKNSGKRDSVCYLGFDSAYASK